MSDVLPACVLPSNQKTEVGKASLNFVYFRFYAARFATKNHIAKTLPRPTADDIHVDKYATKRKTSEPDGACCPVRRVSTWFKNLTISKT
ncbi:MAG: hypothetical protein ABL933_09350 [Methyloglobulus sp.]|nr:hypothetical protein [Methyloglobulus sp.]